MSCCAATGRKLLTLSSDAVTFTFLRNTWNTLPESYPHSVYRNTLPTVKHQIPQAVKTTSAVVSRAEAAPVNSAIHLDYLTSNVALEEPEIGSTDPNIPIDNSCTDDELHIRMPGCSGDHGEMGDESYEPDAIPNASLWRWAATALEGFDLGTGDVDRFEGEGGADVDADDKEDGSQADDESTQNL